MVLTGNLNYYNILRDQAGPHSAPLDLCPFTTIVVDRNSDSTL